MIATSQGHLGCMVMRQAHFVGKSFEPVLRIFETRRRISAYSYNSPLYSLADWSDRQRLFPLMRNTPPRILTLASKRIKRSFLFLSNTPILTLKKPGSFPLSFLGDTLPLPLASGLANPIPGAPNTLGSLKGDEAGIEGTGELGRFVGFVRAGDRNDGLTDLRGGEFDHDGLMSGSMLYKYAIGEWDRPDNQLSRVGDDTKPEANLHVLSSLVPSSAWMIVNLIRVH